MLSAYVEIVLATHDVVAARAAADDLSEIARQQNSPFLRALAAHAHGAVLLAEGDARAALESLRKSWVIWTELRAPYQAARSRVLIAQACRELGDVDAADMELSAAHKSFEKLGAAPDVARVAALAKKTSKSAGPLTGREVEVLKLVASGKTNRAIAAKLAISEKTVARHISNIFNKLDLSSRAAATAYAYQHKIV